MRKSASCVLTCCIVRCVGSRGAAPRPAPPPPPRFPRPAAGGAFGSGLYCALTCASSRRLAFSVSTKSGTHGAPTSTAAPFTFGAICAKYASRSACVGPGGGGAAFAPRPPPLQEAFGSHVAGAPFGRIRLTACAVTGPLVEGVHGCTAKIRFRRIGDVTCASARSLSQPSCPQFHGSILPFFIPHDSISLIAHLPAFSW